MEQLTQIIQERKRAVFQIHKNNEEKHKFQLIQQERKRNDRQNWILRVLKSLRQLSIEQKKVIYETTIKMMTSYHPMETSIISFESVNFLQLMINLFVDFFNRLETVDFTHLKAVIRPNNNYIIVDLLKALIDIGRKEFKIALQQHFKDHFSIPKKISVKSLLKLPLINSKPSEQPQIISQQDPKQNKIPLNTKMRYFLYEKYNKVIENCNFQHIYQRVNQVYFDLLYLNQKNSIRIQRYLDSCFGPKRLINYDASGLYTQEEIKKLVKDQKQRATMRLSQIKQLKGDCSSEQLKEYFKMKVELYESTTSIPIFAKQLRIRQWFPFCLIKAGDKLHPYRLMVELNGNYFNIPEFQERYGKKIKVYMKELLIETKGETDMKMSSESQYIRFKKKNFMDHNYAKVMELLHEEPPIVSFKKEQQLPTINQVEELLDRKRKVKSEAKLPNKSLMMPPVKTSHPIEKEIQKRLNYSSIAKDLNFPAKRKIDTMIEQFIKFTK